MPSDYDKQGQSKITGPRRRKATGHKPMKRKRRNTRHKR